MSRRKNKREREKRKMSRLQIFLAICAGLTLLVAVIQLVNSWKSPNSEVEEIKTSIYNDIKTIEDSFKPEQYIEKDSSFALFQRDALKLCALWQSFEKPISFELFENRTEDLQIIIQNDYFDKLKEFTTISEILAIHYGIDAALDKSLNLNLNTMEILPSLLHEKNKIADKYHERCISLMREAAILHYRGKDNNQKLHKSLDQFNRIKMDPEFYKYDKEIFNMIIEFNKAHSAKYLL